MVREKAAHVVMALDRDLGGLGSIPSSSTDLCSHKTLNFAVIHFSICEMGMTLLSVSYHLSSLFGIHTSYCVEA